MKDKKKIIFNILFFIIVFGITYYMIFKDIDYIVFAENLKRINLIYVFLGILVMICFYLIESINIKFLLSTFNKKISLPKMLKFSLIGAFFSAITPASSGGQPMQIYYMSKENIKVSHSTLSLLIHLCGYQLFTVIFGIIFVIIKPELLNGGILYICIIGILFNLLVLLLTFIGIFSKKITNKLVLFIMKILNFFKFKKINDINDKIKKELEVFNNSSKYIKSHKKEFIKSILIAGIQVFCNYSVIYFTYKAFSLNEYSFIYLFGIQAILRCVVNAIPLPGAVGISESAFLILYSKIFNKSILTNALLLHRTISFYLFVLINLIVVLINNIYLSHKKNKS